MKKQIYEVEIKSQSLLREGKKGLVTYFQGGQKKRIVSNAMVLYPQYTKPEDKPMINITPITFKEYQERVEGQSIKQKQHLLKAEGNIV